VALPVGLVIVCLDPNFRSIFLVLSTVGLNTAVFAVLAIGFLATVVWDLRPIVLPTGAFFSANRGLLAGHDSEVAAAFLFRSSTIDFILQV